MVYRAIGLMSGSSLDGLDIVFAEFHENGGQWQFEILASGCYNYSTAWKEKLQGAVLLPAKDYLLLHTAYGHYIGEQVNRFIEAHQLQYKVAVIASHGHTTFHLPAQKMTAQLGEGAAIAAATRLPVVTELRSLDVAFGGQGAPIVPIGEKMLLQEYHYFLNLGGIANLSANGSDYIAFDVCPANRVLNMLVNTRGMDYDEGGKLAATGAIDESLRQQLNALDYYAKSYPKSLSNDFGTACVYPLIMNTGISIENALRTYVEHINDQVCRSFMKIREHTGNRSQSKLLVTGGGAHNDFLMQRLKDSLKDAGIEVIQPAQQLIDYKEAMIMAFIGVLRWRQEYNVLSSVTGAARNSIGGSLWTGQEA